MAVRWNPVTGFLISTLAPGITAPVASTILPWIVPAVPKDCAWAAVQVNEAHAKASTNVKILLPKVNIALLQK